MNLGRLWTITRLELTQRMRSVSWYVLLGVFAFVLLGVTALAFVAYGGFGTYIGDDNSAGAGVYSVVVFVSLLLVVLVSPTFAGNSINGDRDSATLAPVQVTLTTTGEIILGKFIAAWITGLAFAVVSVPFLIVATTLGGVNPWTVVTSIAIVVVEIGVVSALGVAFSGILGRPLFSVAVTYLVVAALTVGTPIAFGLVGASIQSPTVQTYQYAEYNDDGSPVCQDGSESCWNDPEEWVCGPTETYESVVPRFDYVWWILAMNPFVVLADATPTQFDSNGYPEDAFGYLKLGIRGAQQAPELDSNYSECQAYEDNYPTPEEIMANSVPSWFVGLGLQVVMAGLLLFWAYTRTRTPARKLPPGTRIA